MAVIGRAPAENYHCNPGQSGWVRKIWAVGWIDGAKHQKIVITINITFSTNIKGHLCTKCKKHAHWTESAHYCGQGVILLLSMAYGDSLHWCAKRDSDSLFFPITIHIFTFIFEREEKLYLVHPMLTEGRQW